MSYSHDFVQGQTRRFHKVAAKPDGCFEFILFSKVVFADIEYMRRYQEEYACRSGGWWLVTALVIIMGRGAGAEESYQYRQAIDDPLGRQKAKVVEVYGEYAVRGTKVHKSSTRRMFNTGVKRLSGHDNLGDAWREFIHDDDVVALKFTHVGAKEMAINTEVSGALLESLYRAGFKPKNFMLVGLDELPEQAKDTIPWQYGWQKKPVDFGSDQDYLAQWLEEVTAIVNVCSIMDDNIIGLRGAMANLTWPLIKSPARLYKNHGDPFIPEIYSLPQIRGKVRLHIALGLRILYQGGPEVRQTYIDERKTLLLSRDPVALDRVGLSLIRKFRRTLPMPENVSINISADYLDTAFSLGLGYNNLHFIDYQRLPHEKKDSP